jgi:L-threonylcarbamoyladenylate synthase
MSSSTNERLGTNLDVASAILHSGGIIGLPTETVYGLGADAHNDAAVAAIFRVKGRPVDHPLIVHLPDTAAARTWAKDWPASAEALARHFWPGPFTLIVTKATSAPNSVTGGRSTVALRVPQHPLTLRLLRDFPGGIAAPSANRFGRVSPTTAEHVLADLGDDVDYVLDGGPCDVGVESTIVDCSVSPPQILRFGAISIRQIESLIGPVADTSGPSRAPGMLESHYAPRCQVHPVETVEQAHAMVSKLSTRTRILNGSVDAERFAHDLYALLRLCDDDDVEEVFIVLPQDDAIGRAIRDRVLKAAADHQRRD